MSIFVIAEIGINHNGDINIAKKLIDAAYSIGWDCVKFQKRSIGKHHQYLVRFSPPVSVSISSKKLYNETISAIIWHFIIVDACFNYDVISNFHLPLVRLANPVFKSIIAAPDSPIRINC